MIDFKAQQKLDDEQTSQNSLVDHSNSKGGKDDAELSRIESVSDGIDSIKERGLSWKSTTAIMLMEYVVLAILALPYSFATLGLAGGIIVTILNGLATLFTSHLLWRYCMAHPSIRNVADAAQVMCNGSQTAWTITFIGLAANNYAIMGVHVIAGAQAIQTLRGGTESTLLWSFMIGLMMMIGSYIREFRHFTLLGIFASSAMLVCVMIVMVGHGVQGTPNGYTPALGLPIVSMWPRPGTSFVDILNAILNITYTWVGQALVPTIIGDMREPEYFPRALYISMAVEFVLYTTCGAVVYYYAGAQYTTGPAYGSLIERYGKPAAVFVLPTIIIVGMLYSFITARAIFFQVFSPDSIHRRSHTVRGWSTWLGIVTGGWIISFLMGQAVPFFNNLISLISSLFDSWFGFIMWGIAWYLLNKGKRLTGTKNIIENLLSGLMIAIGVFFFFAGTYTAIQSILDQYATGNIKRPFQSTNTGFVFDR